MNEIGEQSENSVCIYDIGKEPVFSIAIEYEELVLIRSRRTNSIEFLVHAVRLDYLTTIDLILGSLPHEPPKIKLISYHKTESLKKMEITKNLIYFDVNWLERILLDTANVWPESGEVFFFSQFICELNQKMPVYSESTTTLERMKEETEITLRRIGLWWYASTVSEAVKNIPHDLDLDIL